MTSVDVVALVLEEALEQREDDERPRVADVDAAVDRRPAGVDPDAPAGRGDELCSADDGCRGVGSRPSQEVAARAGRPLGHMARPVSARVHLRCEPPSGGVFSLDDEHDHRPCGPPRSGPGRLPDAPRALPGRRATLRGDVPDRPRRHRPCLGGRAATHGARVHKGTTNRRPDVVIGTDAGTWLALRHGATDRGLRAAPALRPRRPRPR